MKKLSLLVFGIMLLFSCNETYRDFQDVKDMKWYRSDVKTFHVNIPEDGFYDLYFAFRHSTGYPFTSIKVSVEQTTPDGNVLTKDAEFLTADENGNYIGEVTGQLWDLQELFSANTELKKGEYTFKISHNMNNDPVILVIDVGLIVKESEQDE